jgi:uncharacterized tellurite resistance protein B-like protein
MSTRNELIADLLMGAAYADSQMDGREYEVVKKLLAQVMNVEGVPEELMRHLEGFDPKSFDPATAVASLGLSDDRDKRHLLELVAAVTEADEEIDLDEHEYLETLARALDLPRNTYSDLTLEVLSVENLQAVGAKLIEPPPIPAAAKK